MKLKKYLAALGCAAVIAVPAAYAAGLFQTLPIIGGGAYCASSIGVGPVQGGITGFGAGTANPNQTTGTTICGQTVPAGPSTFAGTEVVPMDLFAPGTAQQVGGPATALANINQLGQGNIIDSTSASGSLTVPNGTGFFVLDTGTAATVAVTLPGAAVEGQIFHLLCGAAVGTALSVVGNTNPTQTIKGNTPATCTAGQGFAWRFSAAVPQLPNNGGNGVIVANSWVRIY